MDFLRPGVKLEPFWPLSFTTTSILRPNFMFCHGLSWFGLGRMILTLVFMPDTTGLDIKEADRRWAYIREGREYHGIAIHRQHLSWWEVFRGVHKDYNAEFDYKQKVDELRADWEASYAAKVPGNDDSDTDVTDVDSLGNEINSYFERTPPIIRAKDKTIDEKLDVDI